MRSILVTGAERQHYAANMPAGLQLEVAHAVLYVCDVDEMIAFYCRALGFELTDRGPLEHGPEIAFLSQTSNAHHQLALVSGRAEVGPSPNLHHVAYRSRGTLDDLRDLYHRLQAEPGVSNIRPRTHGNAWSVYFADPEGNGIEVFIDTPWHVAQPCGHNLALDEPNEAIERWTLGLVRGMREFRPISAYYQARAEHLGHTAR